MRRIRNFLFASKLISVNIHGSYSLHIRMFWYIRKHHLFASFLHIRFKIFAKIRIQIFDLLQDKYISHTGEYLLQNIRFEANIRKTLSEFHIEANIRWQKFTH
jgi:hypothetical protein